MPNRANEERGAWLLADNVKHAFAATLGLLVLFAGWSPAYAGGPPGPLLQKGQDPVEWWFVFKFNANKFSGCGGPARQCIFGGDVQDYSHFGQQYVYASKGKALKKGVSGCIGDNTKDPVAATFEQVYNGSYFFVLWNDQFYKDPEIPSCTTFCDSPWAHSKGMLAWDDSGAGFVMQVSTPNWPGAGSKTAPRQNNGNTLGCLTSDGEIPQNNVLVSQHFFALQLTKDDVVKVLGALKHAGVVTVHSQDADDRDQVINNGGPDDIRQLVDELGEKPKTTSFLKETLSTGVQVIAKSAKMAVPPWQMVSAVLGGVSLRVATWYSANKIPDTDGHSTPGCWDSSLGQPGAVTNADKGHWGKKEFGLFGGSGTNPDRNHAKVGVSKTGHLVIFGDMNQEGTLTPKCAVRQNKRGGLFFVVEDSVVAPSVRNLLKPLPPQ